MKRFGFVLALWVLTVFLLGINGKPAFAEVPKFKKVVLVLFENENIDKPLSQPFFSRLAREGALLTNYHAITHPSEPNYIALISGDTFGIADDANHDLDGVQIGDLLESKGKSWRNYAEDFPGGCFLGDRKGGYVRKHTPFLSFKSVSTTRKCENVVDAGSFPRDLKEGRLPDFSFYTPNMDDDAHDTDIQYGEKWFKATFEPLLRSKEFKDVLLIVTFDENECNTVGPHVSTVKRAKCQGDDNRVYTVFYGAGVKAGTKIDARYDHYDLLRTIEAGFGLPDMGRKDAAAVPIADVWK